MCGAFAACIEAPLQVIRNEAVKLETPDRLVVAERRSIALHGGLAYLGLVVGIPALVELLEGDVGEVILFGLSELRDIIERFLFGFEPALCAKVRMRYTVIIHPPTDYDAGRPVLPRW